MARLTAEQTKLQRRIEAMYEDKLDGLIDGELYRRKVDEARAEQARLAAEIAAHHKAEHDEQYDLAELARRAADLFEQQPAAREAQAAPVHGRRVQVDRGGADVQVEAAVRAGCDHRGAAEGRVSGNQESIRPNYAARLDEPLPRHEITASCAKGLVAQRSVGGGGGPTRQYHSRWSSFSRLRLLFAVRDRLTACQITSPYDTMPRKWFT